MGWSRPRVLKGKELKLELELEPDPEKNRWRKSGAVPTRFPARVSAYSFLD